MRAFGTVAAAAAMLWFWPSPAGAQAMADPAIGIFVAADGYPGPGEMRAAGPVGDPTRWIEPADVPASLVATARAQTLQPRMQVILAQIGIELTVGADDGVTDCRGSFGSSAFAPQLCDLIRKRGSFRHALTRDGKPAAGTARMTIQFSVGGEGADIGLPPAPMSVGSWPVRDHGYAVSVVREPEWKRFSRVRDGHMVAVQLIFRNGATVDCRAIKPSGDLELDRASCAAARSGEYGGDAARSYARLPMMIAWQRDGAHMILPARSKWQPAAPRGSAGLVVHGFARAHDGAAWLQLSAIGAVTECRITESSGSDPADVAMCAMLEARAFDPALDVFGRPFETRFLAKVRFE